MKINIDKLTADIAAVLKRHRVHCNVDIEFQHDDDEWNGVTYYFVGKGRTDLTFKAAFVRVPDEEPE